MISNHRRGESHWTAKLTEADVRAIRAEYAAGARVVDLAKSYPCSKVNVHHIVHGRRWKHLLPAVLNGYGPRGGASGHTATDDPLPIGCDTRAAGAGLSPLAPCAGGTFDDRPGDREAELAA